MKRAEALQPLSREHLAALLAARRLREAEDAATAARDFLEEHLAIRREALRLAAGELALERLHELGTLLYDHVRFEERELFPAIEEALDAAAIERLAAAIEAAEADG